MPTILEIFMYKEEVTHLIRRVFPKTNHYRNEENSFIYTSHEGEGYDVVFPKDLSYLIEIGLKPYHIARCMTDELVSIIYGSRRK